MSKQSILTYARLRASLTAVAVSFGFQLLGLGQALAQNLNQNVLVVYNATDANSISVANYYAAKRSIPAANLCSISPPANTYLTWSQYVASVKTPVQNCILQTPNQIFYIVFSYNTPFKVVGPDGLSYALDSYVSDIWDLYTPGGQYGWPPTVQPYYDNSQSQGNVYTPFTPFSQFNTIVIYSVWRLDAATPALAEGLVDKALQAESSGASGQVCVDEWFSTATYDYTGSGSLDWGLRQTAAIARQAGFTVTQDANAAEFGTSPAPLSCSNAIYYSGGYGFNTYNNAFTWNPGAIGFHLDSASAYSPRSGTSWSPNAIINGITVTTGVVSEPFTQSIPRPDGILLDLFSGANVGDAFLRNTPYLKWVSVNMGDPLYRPFPKGEPAATGPQNSLGLYPRYLVGGSAATGIVTLASPAPAGGTTVTLASKNTTIATVPPSIVIPAGQTTGQFPINTNLVIQDTPLYITATAGTTTLVNTLVPRAMLSALSLSPASVIAGTETWGFVHLNAPAPTGGITVNLSSNNSGMSIPATVTVSEGASVAQFPIGTPLVPVTTSVIVSASYAGATRNATLTLTPLQPISVVLSPTAVLGSTSTVANLVRMNGTAPVDTTVTLSSSDPSVGVPASITVLAGTNASPNFTITTSLVSSSLVVTISATCNSVTKAATLTVNPLIATPVLSPTAVVGGVSATLNRITLNGPAPNGGITVNLTSSDGNAQVPATVTIAGGATASAYFTITTSPVSATDVVTISAIYNGITKTASLTVNPVALTSVTVSPTSVVGGVSATSNRVTLTGPAPSGGITVNLTSSDGNAQVPATVTIAGGATASAYFTITTSPVSATDVVTISAIYHGITKTASLTVNPIALTSVTVSPTSVVGGVSATYNRVTLTGPAPSGGITVNLKSSDGNAQLPATVTVPAGATYSAYFTITTSPVTATDVVTISASFNGTTKTGTLTVNPAALLSVTLSPASLVGGVSATLNRVNLTGPAPSGGVTVTLQSSDGNAQLPTTIAIAGGATSSAYFTITTSTVSTTDIVTISASYGGITKTATLTINPVALSSVYIYPPSVVGGLSATYNKIILTGPAPPGGLILPVTTSDGNAQSPASVAIAAGASSSAYFTITTSSVATTDVVTISSSYNGVTKTATLTVNPAALLSVTLSPASLVGGVSATLNRVNLNGPAPSGGVTITLTSSDTNAQVPASVTIAGGATSSAYFTITTSSVSTTDIVTISASYGGMTKTANLTINPVALSSVYIYPTSVVGGISTTYNKVILNGPAPPGGITVTVTSSDGNAQPPANVSIPGGATSSAYFTITTSPVAAQDVVTISASYGGVTKTGTLTLNP